MADFPMLSVSEALEASISAATHLEPKHAATIGAARALAAKIDAWDVIVQWAIEDVGASGHRPKVPQNDNTSLGTFARYMDQLGLTVPPATKVPAPVKTEAPEAPAPSSGGASITSLQDRVASLKAR